ncbi:MAG: DUF58 domain-containing protein [Planctomycetota bacterium]|nr:DUF58 domain-containing protein [Planctomycetota bacterium]MDA1105396.1 DUF58 domain-containing protein [Planctomycetota bacterium]
MNGMHRSPTQGPAIEFATHRQYAAGDSVRHLDWKVYARSDKLHVKEYRQETNLEVMVMVDASGSMTYGTIPVKGGWGGTDATRQRGGWTKYDHACAAAAAISFLCLHQRDRVGLGIVGPEGMVTSARRSSARDQWRTIVRLLATQPVGGAAGMGRAVDQALSQPGGRMLFAIASDFLFPGEELRSALARLRHRGHDAILLGMLDRQELRFDMDVSAPFEGLEGEGRIETDARVVRQFYLSELAMHRSSVDRIARSFGFECQWFDTHDSVGPVLASLLARRDAMVRGRKHA